MCGGRGGRRPNNRFHLPAASLRASASATFRSRETNFKLTRGGFVVGVVDAILQRQRGGGARSGAGPALGDLQVAEGARVWCGPTAAIVLGGAGRRPGSGLEGRGR